MLFTTIILSLREIRRHVLRSFLTVLGVVIGVAAVVTMVTLGDAATRSVQAQIASLGSNLLTIMPGQGFGRGGGGAAPQPFKPEDVEAIRTQIGGITATAPQVQTTVTAIRNSANWSVSVNGTSSDFLVGQQWKIVDGRGFTPAEEIAGKSVCLIGNTVRTNLYHAEEPIGTRVRLGDISCEVIGLLATRGQSGFGQDNDNTVLMPYKAVQRRLTGNRNVQTIMVAVDPRYDSKAIQDAITALMRERRKIGADKEDDFNIFDTKQISDTLAGATNTLTRIVTAVAAISLLVGGIGIMNIMLVSVTERTREIGIRLAIGAVAREVLLQFLVEAVVLSSLGGLVGLLIALFACAGLSALMHVPFLWLPQINLIAFAISAAIGVIFGYFPARRAASLNPIDALRHE
ncbi:ABC transporter permease [Flavisphingomonas formosensis]|uniref:ABC transporter permease n=1 Tax=Flavisphingomonas formosensis TaxID=861534 RepID=UPI0012FB9F7F|nr:ABC transporter permease [Sphingomonas formosensis]